MIVYKRPTVWNMINSKTHCYLCDLFKCKYVNHEILGQYVFVNLICTNCNQETNYLVTLREFTEEFEDARKR